MQEQFVKFLGKGSFGSVDLVKFTQPNDGSSFLAAVKTSSQENYHSLQKEVEILSKLSGDPRIVESLSDNLEEGFNSDGSKVYKLFLEYACKGSLSRFMDNYADRILPETLIREFTRMILEGLVTIHGHGYVHCDLKPANLLVFSCGNSYELKISDFGNCLEVGQVPSHWDIFTPFVGTSVYMPPESINDGIATKALDLWSVGCIALAMYTGKHPWSKCNEDDLTNNLFEGKAPEIPETVPCEARKFIEKFFARKPEERGSASELLTHRFLSKKEKIKHSLPLVLRMRRGCKRSMGNTVTPLKVKPSQSQFKKVSTSLRLGLPNSLIPI